LTPVYLDESVNPRVADGLRRRGIDVTTAAQAGKLGTADIEQLVYAEHIGAVLLTHDADFIRISAGRREKNLSHPGVIYAHLHKYGVGTIVKKVAALAGANTFRDLETQIIFL
jgi:hypothetical protein